jgi:hypothetical protein
MTNAPKLSSRNSPRNRRRRGQAMLEYSLIFWLMGVVFILGVTWDGGGNTMRTIDASSNHDNNGHGSGALKQNTTGHDSIFGLMINSYQIYQNSYYFALCAPLP